ncbi:hypothetical protein G4B88_006868 [Cannabis sativa]|uniref:Exonuclease domain-containing protein n=1 Tax=Cannabis sativa TaxID=3483 RepID=A0A7J6G401_CANSA|nr:hypothetical protein G4B88_006868 [Cannabis sativa]
MEDLLATAEKKALVEIVKMVQKRGFKGSKGEWKEFLSGYDKKFGARLSDPAKRSNEVLYVTQLIQSYSKRNLVQKLTRAPENESPEQMLVRLTLEHPQYPLEYSFPSKEQGWIVTKLGKISNVMSTDNILAVDCEMVLCVDGTEAAVRVCVVDRNLEVKLNVLVNPKKEVADYRTEITGITAADLEGVTCTLANVQKSLMKILSSGNILAGHSLSNDLNDIQRDPSSLLGYEVRKAGSPHNCLDDACAAMKLVLARLEQKAGDTIPYKEMNVVPEIETPKLLLHRIPSHVPTEELLTAIPGDFTIETKSNRRIKGDKYTTYAIFKSLQEAEEAYEKVEGSILKDTLGRPQKLVTCKLSTGETYSLCVRSTGRGDCLDENLSKKRAIEVQETSEVTKKLKTDEKIEEETPTENKKTKKERKSKKASKHKKNKKGKKKRA